MQVKTAQRIFFVAVVAMLVLTALAIFAVGTVSSAKATSSTRFAHVSITVPPSPIPPTDRERIKALETRVYALEKNDLDQDAYANYAHRRIEVLGRRFWALKRAFANHLKR
jgi:hypothetical protein